MAQEQSTPKRAPKEGEVAAIAEQVLDIFLDDEPPLAAGFGALLGMDDPDYDLLWDLGVGLHRQEKFSEAEALFSKLCRMQGLSAPRNYKALGAARQRQAKWKSATAAYEFAAVLDVSDPEPAFYAAECLRQLALGERAEQALRSSVAIAGDDPRYAALKERALALLGEGS
jgi:tetratricopeptide (TPR) repeat protein